MKIRVTLCSINPDVGIHGLKIFLRVFNPKDLWIICLANISNETMFDHALYHDCRQHHKFMKIIPPPNVFIICLYHKGNMISKEINSSIGIPAVTKTLFDTVLMLCICWKWKERLLEADIERCNRVIEDLKILPHSMKNHFIFKEFFYVNLRVRLTCKNRLFL